ncbi:MAG: hypothetical protein ACRC33_08215, partial [Gemmataceae bacterium]
MAQVVQVVCPGCKNTLRVPAEWAGQPLRCKHCKAVLQSKKPAGPPPVPPSQPTPPPPPPRKPAAPPAKAAAPPPMLEPIAETPAAAFDFDEPADDPRPRRRRAKPGSGVGTWVALGLLVGTLIGGGVAVALNFERIKAFAASLGNPPLEEEEPGAKKAGPARAKVGAAGFPRRALVISVHNYLYANPITA